MLNVFAILLLITSNHALCMQKTTEEYVRNFAQKNHLEAELANKKNERQSLELEHQVKNKELRNIKRKNESFESDKKFVNSMCFVIIVSVLIGGVKWYHGW